MIKDSDEHYEFLLRTEAIGKIIARRTKALKSAKDEYSKLLETCPHFEVNEIRDHYEGGYLDRASTTITRVCQLCGKVVFTQTEMHDYYG